MFIQMKLIVKDHLKDIENIMIILAVRVAIIKKKVKIVAMVKEKENRKKSPVAIAAVTAFKK